MSQDRSTSGVPDEPARPAPYEDRLRARALKRLKRKAEFRQHLTSYLVVNVFLVLLWSFTGRGHFWPIWPILGWGVGLAFHGLSLTWDDGPSADQVEAEAERLRRRDQSRGLAAGPGDSGAPGSGGPGLPPAPPQPGPWDLPPRDAD